MLIKSINIINFRNYEHLKLDFDKKINIFYGKNAQGKTNLLEAIYFIGLTKSHRTFFDQELIKENSDFFSIQGDIELDYSYTFKIDMINNRKKCYIDANFIKKHEDYIGKFKVVMFCPDDLNIIKDLPNLRRNYLDTQISQHSTKYYGVLTEFNKLLKSRNNMLKDKCNGEKIDITYFEILTKFMINKMVYIYHARCKYIERINEVIGEIYYELTGYKGLFLSYKTDVNLDFINNNVDKLLEDLFFKNQEKEFIVGSTLYGPQKDDIEFILENKNLKKFGSQGQQRMAVIALKLASIEILKKYNMCAPVLLLDDVFSELDEEKRDNLLKYINGNVQTFITTTDLSSLDINILENAKIFNVEKGKIIER